jgi:hypothetical protein
MAKVKLALGAELNTATPEEIGEQLHKHGGWMREAATALKLIDLPIQRVAADGSDNVNLGGDQAGQSICGPTSGWLWSLMRVSIYGIQGTDVYDLWNGAKFVTRYTGQAPGSSTWSKGGLVLHPGDFLRLTGTGVTGGTNLTLTGQAWAVPAELAWKLF